MYQFCKLSYALYHLLLLHGHCSPIIIGEESCGQDLHSWTWILYGQSWETQRAHQNWVLCFVWEKQNEGVGGFSRRKTATWICKPLHTASKKKDVFFSLLLFVVTDCCDEIRQSTKHGVTVVTSCHASWCYTTINQQHPLGSCLIQVFYCEPAMKEDGTQLVCLHFICHSQINSDMFTSLSDI
jgi:hypothetical protein